MTLPVGRHAVDVGRVSHLEQLARLLEPELPLSWPRGEKTEPKPGRYSLGSSYYLRWWIIEHLKYPERVAVCVDSCHIFAAGYPLATPDEYAATMREFDRIIGLDRLAAIHVNDSVKGLGSRVDRHDHIGKGSMGLTPFRLLMKDKRFAHVPKILETPKEKDMEDDRINLGLLRSLAAA